MADRRAWRVFPTSLTRRLRPAPPPSRARSRLPSASCGLASVSAPAPHPGLRHHRDGFRVLVLSPVGRCHVSSSRGVTALSAFPGVGISACHRPSLSTELACPAARELTVGCAVLAQLTDECVWLGHCWRHGTPSCDGGSSRRFHRGHCAPPGQGHSRVLGCHSPESAPPGRQAAICRYIR